jgi:hypothetical protein
MVSHYAQLQYFGGHVLDLSIRKYASLNPLEIKNLLRMLEIKTEFCIILKKIFLRIGNFTSQTDNSCIKHR